MVRSNNRRGAFSAIGALIAFTLLAGCGDRETSAPVIRDTPPIATAPHGLQVEWLSCNANVAARSVTCGRPTSATSAASTDLIIGGQGTYVTLTSSNVAYDAGTGIFSFDATVQNLIPQALGTTDGTTADGTGVRVFFNNGPTVTAGTGSASVANPTGVAAFTSTNQPYFQYTGADLGSDGMLAMNETSTAENWQLSVTPTVTSFEFTVYVSANVQFPNGYVDVTGASPFLLQSGTQSLGATTRTAAGNPLTGETVTFASSAPAVATVDANSGVITGVAPGTATITATSSASTTGTVTVQVCPNLAIGESYATSGSDASSICLGGMGSTTEYTVIPTNSSTSSAVSLTLTGSNIQAVTGPPSPTVMPSGGLRLSAAASDAGVGTRGANAADGDVFGAVATSENAQVGRWSGSGRTTNLVREVMAQTVGGPYVPDDSYVEPDVSDGSATQALLADGIAPASGGRERLMWYPPSNSDVALTRPESGADDRLANNAGGSASDGMAVKTMLPSPAVGDTVQYNTTNACSGSPSVRTGVVRSVSTHALVVADTANPAGGFTTSQYDSIGLEFDTIAYQVDAANFGTPTDVDGNGHVVLFFTRAVNELSPPMSSIVTLGTFAQKDVFTNAECSNGNAAEMLYLLVPDPTGAVNSNVRTVPFVRGNVIGTAGHEMAKMIDAFGRYQRSAPFESGWLDESLGAFAEELMFYRTSVGLTPKQNLIVANVNTGPNASRRVAAFNTYANQNLTRLRSWLQRPDTSGIAGSTSLARTGFGWAFLRYASDRKGAGDPAFLQSLLTSSDTGMANIQGAIGGSAPSDWIRDFVAALYADDNAFSVAAPLQFPSWNLRSFFAILYGSYQLAPRVLTNNTLLTLSYGKGNGASVYGRVGVAASTFATITLSSAGSTPPPTVQLMVIRTK